MFVVLDITLQDMKDKMSYPNCWNATNPWVTEHWTQTLKYIYDFSRALKIQELLGLKAHKRFRNTPMTD